MSFLLGPDPPSDGDWTLLADVSEGTDLTGDCWLYGGARERERLVRSAHITLHWTSVISGGITNI